MFMKTLQMILKKRFDTSNYDVDRPLTTGKNKKDIRLIRDELEGRIMTEFVTLAPKTYSHLMDDGNTDKESKRNKEMCNKKYT